MSPLIHATLFLSLLVVSLLLCTFGLNSYVLLYLNRRRKWFGAKKNVAEWPFVTIQIPVYNEKNVIERTLENCLKLDYPKERFEIVVVDDSTDETTDILEKCEAKFNPQIRVIHRMARQGYKAGALNTAMKHSVGEYFLILDADTSPNQDFLKETIPYFIEDDEIGFTQGKIEYINAESSWLTRTQALTNDWYRTFNQSALSKAGMLLSFVGHGGVFRKSAIEDAGCWQSDTITEDMDLSYRVQMSGWKGIFAEEAKCVEEVPSSYLAVVTQYDRHMKGPIQNLSKHCIGILTNNRLSALKKFEALIQMAYPLSYPLGLLCVALTALTYLILPSSFLACFWSSPAGMTFSLFTLVTLPYVSLVTSFPLPLLLIALVCPLFYLLTLKRKGPRASKRLATLLGVTLIWNDNLLNGTKALIELLLGKKPVWIPTPKLGKEPDLASSSLSKGERQNRIAESALRIIAAGMIILSVVFVMTKDFVINSLGLLLPASAWLVSAYLLFKSC